MTKARKEPAAYQAHAQEKDPDRSVGENPDLRASRLWPVTL